MSELNSIDSEIYVITAVTMLSDKWLGKELRINRDGTNTYVVRESGFALGIGKFDPIPKGADWPESMTNYAGTTVQRVIRVGGSVRGGVGTPLHDGKLDSGKVDPGMLFHGCARALRAVLSVLEFGARKYAPDSWRKVPNAEVRYRAAFERHKQLTDENGLWDIDPETGKYHVDHMITNLLFLRELKAEETK